MDLKYWGFSILYLRMVRVWRLYSCPWDYILEMKIFDTDYNWKSKNTCLFSKVAIQVCFLTKLGHIYYWHARMAYLSRSLYLTVDGVLMSLANLSSHQFTKKVFRWHLESELYIIQGCKLHFPTPPPPTLPWHLMRIGFTLEILIQS